MEGWGKAALLGLAAGAGTVIAVAYTMSKRPKLQYEEVGKVKTIVIYPIKSCRGIIVPEAECTALGLRYGDALDRSFMITDARNHFITARRESRIVLIAPSFKDGKLHLDAPGMETLVVDIPDKNVQGQKCKVWEDMSRGIDCGRDVGVWLEKFLGNTFGSLKLLYHPWFTKERVPEFWDKWDRFKKSDTCIYSDLCGFNFTTESSLADLNSRLTNKVTSFNFRPNFMIEGNMPPYQEDEWKYVRIGECSFRGIRPCTICVMTTIDPETGIRGDEPLKTLKTYRSLLTPEIKKREGDSPMFGRYIGLDSGKIIRVGDTVSAAM